MQCFKLCLFQVSKKYKNTIYIPPQNLGSHFYKTGNIKTKHTFFSSKTYEFLSLQKQQFLQSVGIFGHCSHPRTHVAHFDMPCTVRQHRNKYTRSHLLLQLQTSLHRSRFVCQGVRGSEGLLHVGGFQGSMLQKWWWVWWVGVSCFFQNVVENFYCPVRISVWLWNLEFAPKNWNKKLLSYFCMSRVISQVNASFWCNFSHFCATCRTFDAHFVDFARFVDCYLGTPKHPIKSHYISIWHNFNRHGSLGYFTWSHHVIPDLFGCFDIISKETNGWQQHKLLKISNTRAKNGISNDTVM